MTKPLRENTFESLEGEMAGLSSDTMPERRAREKRARLKDDGRSGRGAQPYRELNVKISPELKARVVAVCRRKDLLIRDLVEVALEATLAAHEGEE